MENEITTQDLILNLKAAGFDGDMIEKYLTVWENGKIQEQFKLLAEKRASLLTHIHQEQRQIDCLDYLVYKMEKVTSQGKCK